MNESRKRLLKNINLSLGLMFIIMLCCVIHGFFTNESVEIVQLIILGVLLLLFYITNFI